MAIEAEALRDLSEKAPKGPWDLRPQEYDDWGVIRAQPFEGFPYREIVLLARGYDDEAEKSRARKEDRQPERCEAISAFIVALVNAYRDGSLIHRSALAEDTARAAEVSLPLSDHRVLTLRRMLDRADRMQRCLYRDGCIAEGAIYREEVDAIQAVLAPALPLDKEAADANR